MNYLQFREKLHPLGCFNTQQVYMWFPHFERSNFSRWVKKGWLIHLRQDYYAFADYLQIPDFQQFVANRIYRPSYISLHSALSFYGVIPEMVVQTTNVSTLKTAQFQNDFGQFSYKKIKDSLFFGYAHKTIASDKTILIAHPEKALLDLLYLYPFYNTTSDYENLRLDENFMTHEFDLERLQMMLPQFQCKTLNKRVTQLLKIFDLCLI